MMNKKILIAVPKGRIMEELEPLLVRIGIVPEADFFDAASRKLVFTTSQKNIDLVKVRSFDVATFVKFGAADAGICGLDVLKEFPSPEIFAVLNLKIGKCRLSIAAKKSAALDLAKRSHIRIATKYVTIATDYFSQLGIQAEPVKLNGAVEIAPLLNLCDFILDLVSSGKTLAQNQMTELSKILDVTSYLIINRASFKTANQEINQLIKIFDVT
jgi:ATP phosphoribosyltransferase